MGNTLKNWDSFWTTNDNRAWAFGVAFQEGCFSFSFAKWTWTLYKEQG